jgi:hypothetical protein
MPTQCDHEVVEASEVVAAFDGGDRTSEAGGPLRPRPTRHRRPARLK